MGDESQEDKKSNASKIVGWILKNIVLCIIFLVAFVLFFIFTDWLWNWWDWEAIGAIATGILAIGVVVAIIQVSDNRHHADKQAEDLRQSTNARIAMELFRELHDETTLGKIRTIYNIDIRTKYLSQNQKNNVDYILSRFDLLGNLVKLNIISEKIAVETYGGPQALRIWYRINKYIKNVQNDRGYYGHNFEGFVKLSLDYFDNNNITILLYKDDEKNIEPKNLNIELKRPELLPRSWDEIKEQRKTGVQHTENSSSTISK
jgi:uncharacterized membrane protein